MVASAPLSGCRLSAPSWRNRRFTVRYGALAAPVAVRTACWYGELPVGMLTPPLATQTPSFTTQPSSPFIPYSVSAHHRLIFILQFTSVHYRDEDSTQAACRALRCALCHELVGEVANSRCHNWHTRTQLLPAAVLETARMEHEERRQALAFTVMHTPV